MSRSMQLMHNDSDSGGSPGVQSPQEQNFREFGSKLAVLVSEYNNLIESEACSNPIRFELDDVLKLKKLGQRADWLYRARRKRSKYFGAEIFGEAAWDILLDLFSAECRGKAVSITSACIGSGVPSTTALRWITALSEGGLVERFDDPQDRRRAFVRLTGQGRSAMVGFLEETLKN